MARAQPQERPAIGLPGSRAPASRLVLLLAFAREEHRSYQARTLADVARERGGHPLDVAMDLMAADRTRVPRHPAPVARVKIRRR
jgi:N-acyl-D-aspartate/D-glutamate deacylase